MSLILTDYHNLVATITFNHDKKRICLSKALLEEMLAALRSFQKQQARVLVIRAYRGAPVCSADLDINELPQPGQEPLPYFGPLEQVLRAIQRFPAPVIAMIEGSVWGGACDLALICDIVIGTPTATFAITPAKVGIPYNPSGILHFINPVGPKVDA